MLILLQSFRPRAPFGAVVDFSGMSDANGDHGFDLLELECGAACWVLPAILCVESAPHIYFASSNTIGATAGVGSEK